MVEYTYRTELKVRCWTQSTTEYTMFDFDIQIEETEACEYAELQAEYEAELQAQYEAQAPAEDEESEDISDLTLADFEEYEDDCDIPF